MTTKEDLRTARCPRCNGFLFDARFQYWKYRHCFNGVLHCMNCSRNWRVYRKNGKYEFENFAYRLV